MPYENPNCHAAREPMYLHADRPVSGHAKHHGRTPAHQTAVALRTSSCGITRIAPGCTSRIISRRFARRGSRRFGRYAKRVSSRMFICISPRMLSRSCLRLFAHVLSCGFIHWKTCGMTRGSECRHTCLNTYGPARVAYRELSRTPANFPYRPLVRNQRPLGEPPCL